MVWGGRGSPSWERLSELSILGWESCRPWETGPNFGVELPQTLVLVGCFATFWTVYYVLEVYLSQRDVASHPVCRRPCHWLPRSQKAGEERAELESVPLCSSKDPRGAEAAGPVITAGAPAPGLQGREEQMC